MYTILCLNNVLSASSDRKIAGIIVPRAPKATKPMFPPPARARSELDSDKIRVALKFSNVTEIIPTNEMGRAYCIKSRSDICEKYDTPLKKIEEIKIKVSISNNSLSFAHMLSLNLHNKTYKTRNTEKIIGIAAV